MDAEEDPAGDADRPEKQLPLINLVESGGADLPTQKDIFIPGGQIFRDLTRLSAAGIPTIALVFGNSTAGGAYVPGMSDHVVMVEGGAKVFLGGPPLVRMATGEIADEEELGGAVMHGRVSGLADHVAVDEPDARSGSDGGSWPGQTGASAGRSIAEACRRATPRTSCSASSAPTSRSRSTP